MNNSFNQFFIKNSERKKDENDKFLSDYFNELYSVNTFLFNKFIYLIIIGFNTKAFINKKEYIPSSIQNRRKQ